MAESPVFLYVTVAFKVWPALIVVLFSARPVRIVRTPGVGAGPGLTVMAMSSLVWSALSVAVKRSTYAPEAEKLAVVFVALALLNVTVPGPLTLDQVVVSVLPAGKRSSVAVPFKVAEDGKVMV